MMQPLEDKIKELEAKLLKYESSPYSETYNAIFSQVSDWNEQLRDTKIDLFANKEAKEFDRAWKYILESSSVLDNLDRLRMRMSPEEQKEIEAQVKIKNIGMAEKIAMKQNGTKQK